MSRQFQEGSAWPIIIGVARITMALQDSFLFSSPSPRLLPSSFLLSTHLLPPPSDLAMACGTTRVDSSSGPAENGRTDEPAPSARRFPRVGDYLGKHRLSAAIGRLHQEIQSLEILAFGDFVILHMSYERFRDLSDKSEFEELDKMEPSSAACNDVLSSMEGIPDALLPITKGPENSAWERWFQPVRSSRNRKWWSNRESNVS